MHNDVNKFLKNFWNFIKICIIAFFCMVIMLSVTYLDLSSAGIIRDSSFTENLQESLLFTSSLIFLYIAKKYHQRGLLLVSGLFMCMFIREWDAVFDKLLFHGAWKYVGIPVALYYIYISLIEGKEKAASDLVFFMERKPYCVMVLGMIIVLVVSRVLGMRLVGNLLYGDGFSNSFKSFVEEGFELLGYLTIFISSLMYLKDYYKLNKNKE